MSSVTPADQPAGIPVEPGSDRSGGRLRRLVVAVSVGAVLLLGILWAVWASSDGQDTPPEAGSPTVSTAETSGAPAPDPTTAAAPGGTAPPDEPSGEGATGAAATAEPAEPAEPADPGEPGEPTLGAPVTADEAVTAGCRVVGDDLDQLLEVSTAGGVESLRDAVPLLDERLQALESAEADTDGDLTALLAAVRDVREAWAEAIEAADAGDDDASRAALDRAEVQVAELDDIATASGLGDDVCGSA